MNARGSSLKADGVLIAITAMWGLTFVVVKDALDAADPFTFLALRFAVGALAIALVARKRLLGRDELRYGALLSVFLFGGFAFQTFGLLSTTPSRSAFITGLSVLLVPFVSIALLRKWPRVPAVLGVLLAVFGLAYLTGVTESAGEGSGTSTGDLLTLGCAVSYAVQITLTERYAPKVDTLAMVGVQLGCVSLLSLLCLPFVELRFEPNLAFAGAVAFTGVFASAIAIGAQTWAQARTSAVRAALIFSLEPVFAAAYSVLTGYERLGRKEALGGGLIVAAVLVSEVGNAWLDRRAKLQAVPTDSDRDPNEPRGP
jgi:drug/metabolite transporter (DMT)-like permease